MSGPSVLLVHEFGGRFGGAERYLELLGDGLTRRGVRTAAVVFITDADAAAAIGSRLARVAPDARIVVGPSRPGPIRAAVRDHRPDVLHWNFVEPYSFLAGTWLLPPWGRPSVITDHLPQLHHAGRHWEATRRLANRRIRSMVVVGEAARRAAERRWRRPPPLEVVVNGVPLGGGVTRRPRPPGAPLRLLFVGRLTDQKGVDRLVGDLEAVRAAGVDARLTIVGEGPLEPALRAMVAAAGLTGAVDLTGFADDPRPAMTAADALVAPSVYEGLPFTPLEALSTGLPVVLSDIPPHVELAGAGAGLGVQLVRREDREGWVEAVGRLAAHLPAASADALERAAAHDVEDMVAATVAVYHRALGDAVPMAPSPASGAPWPVP